MYDFNSHFFTNDYWSIITLAKIEIIFNLTKYLTSKVNKNDYRISLTLLALKRIMIHSLSIQNWGHG